MAGPWLALGARGGMPPSTVSTASWEERLLFLTELQIGAELSSSPISSFIFHIKKLSPQHRCGRATSSEADGTSPSFLVAPSSRS